MLSACAHVDTSLSGQVIDAESGQPIKNIAVALERQASCFQGRCELHDVFLTPRDPVRPDGRFIIGGPPSPAPCLAFDWVESVRILAPGYFEEVFPGPTFPAAI